MPYYKGRRSYGKRRRYGRRSRRPAASTAVPRTTLAPRHQYLKLRTSFAISTNATVTGHYGFILSTDNVGNPVKGLDTYPVAPSAAAAANPPATNDRIALGYAEYGNIFRKFLVHGCKLQATVAYQGSSDGVNNACSFVMVPRIDQTNITSNFFETSRLPLATQHVLTYARPLYLKRYFSNTKIQGRSVKLFNEYYYPWTLPVNTTDGQSSVHFQTEEVEIGSTLTFRFVLTYYVSALEIKSQFSSVAAAEAVVKATLPGAGYSADQDPTHADFVQDSVTGVPLSTVNMRKLGVTRRRD